MSMKCLGESREGKDLSYDVVINLLYTYTANLLQWPVTPMYKENKFIGSLSCKYMYMDTLMTLLKLTKTTVS